MLVPLSWLREFVPYEGTAQKLGDKLTMLGLELENILHPFAHLAEIKAGFVVQCQMHPDSDHLHCCKVDIGDGELLDIVCGATNVAEGQKVAVAPVGAQLPDGTIIKKAKLRGKPSMGMICSERELGLSEDHSGILVLPQSCVIGHSLLNALSFEEDVLELSITPNRADCLSILGIARETAMAFNLPLHIPELPLIFNQDNALGNSPEIIIDNSNLCWLYAGRIIKNIKIAPSPMHIRYRLAAVGSRAISNIVDITNYILFECGQPLHAFDLDKLHGNKIILRTAKDNEKFITLDGKERILNTTDLCVCDAEKPVALAGVMGGLNSEITPDSKNIFIESAVFRPETIRKTARRLGINSEASFRFERGIDQMRTIWSMNRACSLLESIAGGIPEKNISLNEPHPFTPSKIAFRPSRARLILGADLNNAIQGKMLENTGCSVSMDSETNWTVIQPSWRPDLIREADLVEEVGRIYGFDEIAPKLPPVMHSIDETLNEFSLFDFLQIIKHWGSGTGLNEAINYSFTGSINLDHLGLQKDGRIFICNPLSEDQGTLRNSLIPGLLLDLQNNLAYGTQSIHIFETGNIFQSNNSKETTVLETPCLGILLYGMPQENGWPKQDRDLGFEDMKGLISNLLSFLHIEKREFNLFEKHSFLAPAIDIKCGKESIGFFGQLKTELSKVYNAQKPIWAAELNLELLKKLYENTTKKFTPLPVLPSVKRDLTVIMAKALKVGDVINVIQSRKSGMLESVALIDCFEPENSEEKHLTYRLTFRNATRTLKDAEVDKEREKIAEFLRQKLNVRI